MSEPEKQGIRVCIDPYSESDTNVFRIETADDVLQLLVDAHESEFTIAELVDATGAARSTVWRAVALLDSIGAVRIRETPQRNYISIDGERLQKDDPIHGIEQSQFHEPIRAFVNQVLTAVDETDDVDEIIGIVVFGSVARGEADRQSDIDLFVVVSGDRTSARRMVTAVASSLREQRFDGDRFDFEPYVETEASTHRAGGKLREIFTDGVTVYGGDRLQSIRTTVFEDE